MKTVPDPETWNPIFEKDTLVWQVFENAALDSSKSTGIISCYHRGVVASIFVEVDVSTDSLNLLRGRVLIGDTSMTLSSFKDLWKKYSICVASCCVTCAIGCLFTGPGWPACWAFCCLDCYPACAIGVMFERLLDWLS